MAVRTVPDCHPAQPSIPKPLPTCHASLLPPPPDCPGGPAAPPCHSAVPSVSLSQAAVSTRSTGSVHVPSPLSFGAPSSPVLCCRPCAAQHCSPTSGQPGRLAEIPLTHCPLSCLCVPCPCRLTNRRKLDAGTDQPSVCVLRSVPHGTSSARGPPVTPPVALRRHSGPMRDMDSNPNRDAMSPPTAPAAFIIGSTPRPPRTRAAGRANFGA